MAATPHPARTPSSPRRCMARFLGRDASGALSEARPPRRASLRPCGRRPPAATGDCGCCCRLRNSERARGGAGPNCSQHLCECYRSMHLRNHYGGDGERRVRARVSQPPARPTSLPQWGWVFKSYHGVMWRATRKHARGVSAHPVSAHIAVCLHTGLCVCTQGCVSAHRAVCLHTLCLHTQGKRAPLYRTL